MIAPTPHPQEASRLHALTELGILRKDQRDCEFDQVVALASTIAEVPIALFTIVDDQTQWFRAKVGLDTDETPRNVSFCGHAILSEAGPMIVEDALFDMRFCDNPLVLSEPGIRFYAGVPICTGKNRLPIGTLCVLDRKPRTLEPGKIEALRALGTLLESYLRQMVRNFRLRTENDSLRAIIEKRGTSVFR